MGREVGTPSLEEGDVPRAGEEGIGDASLAMEAWRVKPSGAGETERSEGVRIGRGPEGFSEELSPLSAIVKCCS